MNAMDAQRVPEYLRTNGLRLIIFGGKGGVGKTTMAAAAALQLARAYGRKKKLLLISTDPAHSLGDAFGSAIGDRITPLDNNLFAWEPDTARLIEEFKEAHRVVLGELAERGTYFDRQDIAEFLELSLPGMDEVMAVIEIANLLREGRFDTLILDTAPTGHTVRMLALPWQMRQWTGLLDLMQQKHRYLSARFAKRPYVKDDCDVFIENLSADMEGVQRLLTDPGRTRFVPVTVPETMVVSETGRLVDVLASRGVPVKEIVVNRVITALPASPDTDSDGEGCALCTARREAQQGPLRAIRERFSAYELIEVPLFPWEINGLAGLGMVADHLSGMDVHGDTAQVIEAEYEPPATPLVLQPDLELILFGGKGGVGKTILASAAALHLAARNPGKRVLLFSTDPAHSLSDAFGLRIGNAVTPIARPVINHDGHRATGRDNGSNSEIKSNLFALEISPDKLFQDFKEEFEKDIEELFGRFTRRGVDVRFDKEVMTELIAAAPPGLDEVMALNAVMELREKGDYDVFILDTSPTGHLLRFLELPDMVRQWLASFFRLLLKYKGVVTLTRAAEKALGMSRSVRRIKEALMDSVRTTFVAVTIPEAMAVRELERLMGALEDARIPCGNIAVNMVTPSGTCGVCRITRTEGERYIGLIHSRFPGHTVARVPLFPGEIRGVPDLSAMGDRIFGPGR